MNKLLIFIFFAFNLKIICNPSVEELSARSMVLDVCVHYLKNSDNRTSYEGFLQILQFTQFTIGTQLQSVRATNADESSKLGFDEEALFKALEYFMSIDIENLIKEFTKLRPIEYNPGLYASYKIEIDPITKEVKINQPDQIIDGKQESISSYIKKVAEILKNSLSSMSLNLTYEQLIDHVSKNVSWFEKIIIEIFFFYYKGFEIKSLLYINKLPLIKMEESWKRSVIADDYAYELAQLIRLQKKDLIALEKNYLEEKFLVHLSKMDSIEEQLAIAREFEFAKSSADLKEQLAIAKGVEFAKSSADLKEQLAIAKEVEFARARRKAELKRVAEELKRSLFQ